MLALRYLPANAAYCFTFGRDIQTMQIISMGDYGRYFRTRRDAVLAARSCGLDVCKNGEVISKESEFSFA